MLQLKSRGFLILFIHLKLTITNLLDVNVNDTFLLKNKTNQKALSSQTKTP